MPTSPITTAKLEAAKVQLYVRAQFESYGREIAELQKPDNCLEKDNLLFKLSPYLDDKGVLRIRGRIDAVYEVDDEAKRPINMPRNHRVTELIILQ